MIEKHRSIAAVPNPVAGRYPDTGSYDFGTIAGFVASPAQWEKFRQGWRAVLDAVHVDTFHASDFFPRESWKSSESPYRHWSEAKGRRFQQTLLSVYQPQYKRINAVNAVTDLNDFRRWSFCRRVLVERAGI